MKTILLVEDDIALSKMYLNKLEMSGFTTLSERDGEKGLKTALENHPDLILLDIKMPKMDGITMMDMVRKDVWGKTVPIILLTNIDPYDKIIEAVTADSPSYYLLKAHTTPQEVIDKINEVLTNPAQTL